MLPYDKSYFSLEVEEGDVDLIDQDTSEGGTDVEGGVEENQKWSLGGAGGSGYDTSGRDTVGGSDL